MGVTPEQIEEQVRAAVLSPHNALDDECDAAFDIPVIGYASALHPLFDQTNGRDRALISPAKWLEARFGMGYTPEHISVISWALPMPESARITMRGRQIHPSREWVAARAKADRINLSIAQALTALFERAGIQAVAPVAEGLAQRRSVEQYGTSLPWSEHVAAVASGLGAMRPSCGVVTRVGASVVLGSLVAAARFPENERNPLLLDGMCRKRKGCVACQSRCPIGAIGPDGFDQDLCLKYQSQFVLPYLKERFGFEGRIGCDLCITGVPCEFFPPTEH